MVDGIHGATRLPAAAAAGDQAVRQPAETRFSIRLPRDLHALLLERAAAEHRSLNAQIIHVLWQAFTVEVDAYQAARHQIRPHGSEPAAPLPHASAAAPRRGRR
jgi:hypothetical protein